MLPACPQIDPSQSRFRFPASDLLPPLFIAAVQVCFIFQIHHLSVIFDWMWFFDWRCSLTYATLHPLLPLPLSPATFLLKGFPFRHMINSMIRLMI